MKTFFWEALFQANYAQMIDEAAKENYYLFFPRNHDDLPASGIRITIWADPCGIVTAVIYCVNPCFTK